MIVEEAEEQGKYVLAHAQGTTDIARALRAGVRSIEHGILLDDPTAQLFLDKRAFLVPTLQAPLQVIQAAASGVRFPPGVVEKARMAADAHQASIQRAHAAGPYSFSS